TSIGDLAQAMGVQKGSLYAHIDSKEDLLWEVAREGAAAFQAALDSVPDEGPAIERVRAALRAHLRVVAEQLDVATVFIREWQYLDGARRDQFLGERRRYEERFRALFREGRERGELRTDLDDATAALVALSAANWAYTWLRPGAETDALASGRVRRISLGRVNGRRFTFSAGIGFDAEAVRRMDARGRREDGRRPGDLVFAATLVRVAFERRVRYDPVLEISGLGRAAFAFVANADPYTFAKRIPLHVAPEANFEGGLDVVAPVRVRLHTIPRLLRYVVTGRGQ